MQTLTTFSRRGHLGRAVAPVARRPAIVSVPPDLLGIVSFGTTAQAVLPLTPITAPTVLSAPMALVADGNTNMTDALLLGAAMLRELPRSIVRRMVVVGDGEPNVRTELLAEAVARCREAWVTVETIFCGSDATGEQVLRNISAATVRGQHFTAASYRELKDLIVSSASRLHRRQGATVVAIDCSTSMGSVMPGGQTRIAAAISACQAATLIRRTAFARVGGGR